MKPMQCASAAGVVVSRARTVVLGASHWHVPLYAATIAEVHDVVGLSDDDPERVRRACHSCGAARSTPIGAGCWSCRTSSSRTFSARTTAWPRSAWR